jgi:hypothetical protein
MTVMLLELWRLMGQDIPNIMSYRIMVSLHGTSTFPQEITQPGF